MYSMITARRAMALTLFVAACGDPFEPSNPVDHPTTVEALRQRPAVPVSVPDSVGVPPSIPPIYEEAPPGFDTEK
jgi:hypothetical protein